MESGVYFLSFFLSGPLLKIVRRRIIMVFSVLAVTVLAACEISPDQVKFREPPEDMEQVCNGEGCPDSTEFSGSAGPPLGH
jgi:hypothetical protein